MSTSESTTAGKSPSPSWGCCSRKLKGNKHAKCNKCMKMYHYACLSFIQSYVLPATWLCADCLNDDMSAELTPSRNITTTRGNKKQPPQTSSYFNISSEDVRSMIQETLKNELKAQLSIFSDLLNSNLSRELHPIKEQMEQMNDSMTYMNNQYEDLLKEYSTCKEELKVLQVENSSMKNTITDLNARLNQLEQQTRSNNIEIQCLPEKKQENLLEVVTELSKVVGCNIEPRDIMHCTRVAKLNPKNPRPRSIVVQLASPRIRDQLLAATITYNKSNVESKLNTTHLGYLGPKTPIFVSEHLSANNRALHTAARIKAKEIGYQYVWIRGGRIYMRKTQEAEHILIRDMDTLLKLNK
ncbi:unnamed protein product [Arctia plantaginis]|uniref:FP protein C-terminal domain-containing protein n=1 Tax=Arctia plantaginis TaxID=874455 RepID=A0A8S1BIH4_ARCPL|nr:unnamed protein product [Arctia plantaginis]